MTEFEAALHRTWTHFLAEGNMNDLAAMVIDGAVSVLLNVNDEVYKAWIELPPQAYNFICNNESLRLTVASTFREVLIGYSSEYEPEILIRMRLLWVEEGWKEVLRNAIVNASNPNQGVITEAAFLRSRKQPLVYNEMKFASQSEIRIAQELERRGILFFPLPLAVRNDTGRRYQDHKEVDFLVCNDGVWGILEVSHHEHRYEKDSEKTLWFKRSGILCVEHYTAERCYNHPAETIDGFLDVLSKHKR
jgi:hypothetical protein